MKPLEASEQKPPTVPRGPKTRDEAKLSLNPKFDPKPEALKPSTLSTPFKLYKP